MTDEHHNIDPWFIPDEEQVLANEHEREEIEENGELDDPLCPHCGEPYKDETDGVYTHSYVRVESEQPFESSTLKPGVTCTERATKEHHNGASKRLRGGNNGF